MLLVVTLALGYVSALVKLKSKDLTWSAWHSISFGLGTGLLGIALHPQLMQWAHHDLRGHMVQHLLLGMFAPIFLVLGAPVTLALKTLPVKVARGVTAILRSKVFYLFSHPVVALLLNIGGMYILYLTPLYNVSLTQPWLHYIIHLHFLLAGYLFCWSMIGLEPVPQRPGLRVRIFVLFLNIALHAFLSKLMYAYLLPHNSPHPEEQIREAAKLMYYWGDLSELLLTIALFALWYQKRHRSKNQISSLSVS